MTSMSMNAPRLLVFSRSSDPLHLVIARGQSVERSCALRSAASVLIEKYPAIFSLVAGLVCCLPCERVDTSISLA